MSNARATLLLSAVLLAGCASATSDSTWRSVDQESVFRDRVVDRPLSWPGGFDVEFSPEGRITGQFPQGPVEGAWQWRSGKFCRTISAGGVEREPECLGIELNRSQVRFKRENGGYFLPYNIGEPSDGGD